METITTCSTSKRYLLNLEPIQGDNVNKGVLEQESKMKFVIPYPENVESE